MKFSDGIWRAKEGVTIRSAVEVGKLQTSIDPTSEFWHPFNFTSYDSSLVLESTTSDPWIRALCHTKKVVNPGGTLGTPTILLQMSSPMDGVISCEAYHFRGNGESETVRAELFPIASPTTRKSEESPAIRISHTDDKITGATITSANRAISATVDCAAESFNVNFDGPDGKRLTSIGSDSLQWALNSNARSDAFETEYSVTTGSDPYHREPPNRRKGFMSVSLSIGVNDKIYGLGERFGPFIKNGQTIETSNGDGGTSTYVGENKTWSVF